MLEKSILFYLPIAWGTIVVAVVVLYLAEPLNIHLLPHVSLASSFSFSYPFPFSLFF